MDYITGEKIQELADHSIILNDQSLVKEQLKYTKCNYTYFDRNESITKLPETILNANSLFVYTHELPFFFNKIYPLLKKEFVLVTHNSDLCITQDYIKYLNEDKIKKWFSQNVYCKHPKLIPIPIGIANSQWPHGNLELFDRIRNEKNVKDIIVYKNFDPNTSHCNRLHVLHDTKWIPMPERRSTEDYWRDISRSIFVICPMGSGVDTHRMWESLYLRSIPIVAKCDNNDGFSELPMVTIPNGQFGNWNIITPQYLDNIHEEMKNKANTYKYEKLSLEYWKRRIQSEYS